MAVKTLEKKSDKDLHKDLAGKRKELRDIRFGVAGAKARNPHEAQKIRREVAQILTELNSRNA